MDSITQQELTEKEKSKTIKIEYAPQLLSYNKSHRARGSTQSN